MSTKNSLLVVSAALLLFGAASAQADAPITSLPYTISAPGVYTVTANLSVTGSSAITVSSDNVVIDLAGHTITGTSASQFSGVLCFTGVDPFTPRRNIVVKNGIIRGFKKGIYLTGSANAPKTEELLPAEGFRVSDVTIQGSGEKGIEFGICRSSVIERCNITAIGGVPSGGQVSVPYGIFVQGGVLVRENFVSNLDINNGIGNNCGIYVSGGDGGAYAFVIGNKVEEVFYGLIFDKGVYRDNIIFASADPYRCDPTDTTNAGGNF